MRSGGAHVELLILRFLDNSELNERVERVEFGPLGELMGGVDGRGGKAIADSCSKNSIRVRSPSNSTVPIGLCDVIRSVFRENWGWELEMPSRTRCTPSGDNEFEIKDGSLSCADICCSKLLILESNDAELINVSPAVGTTVV